MKKAATGLGLGLVLLVLGCGSGPSSSSWQVVKTGTSAGTEPGRINTAYVGRPSELEVKITGSPNVTVSTAYASVCGDFGNGITVTQYVHAAKTPVTIPLSLPPGPPNACRLNVGAFHSKAANLTLTLYMRPAPATPLVPSS
jgi:hypothetical protein